MKFTFIIGVGRNVGHGSLSVWRAFLVRRIVVGLLRGTHVFVLRLRFLSLWRAFGMLDLYS